MPDMDRLQTFAEYTQISTGIHDRGNDPRGAQDVHRPVHGEAFRDAIQCDFEASAQPDT